MASPVLLPALLPACATAALPSLPVTAGLIGWYAGSSFDAASGAWRDLSAAAAHAQVQSGSASVVQDNAANFLKWQSVVVGSTTTAIAFPATVLPASYTLCHVARFTSSARAGIFSSSTERGWFSGFYQGAVASSLYLGSASSNPGGTANNGWQLICEQPMMLRASGIQLWGQVGAAAAGARPVPMGINANPSAVSDFAVAAVVAYNRLLSTAEVLQLEEYLASSYGLVLSRVRTPPVTRNLLAWYSGLGANTASGAWCPAIASLGASGANPCASMSGTSTVQTGSDEPLVQGSAASSVAFPAGVLPPVYTLFHVARYSGATRRRVFCSTNGVLFHSGFWGAMAGTAHRPTTSWITDTADLHGTGWVVSADQMYAYRSNGVDRTTVARGANMTSGFALRINGMTSPDERSDFQVRAVLVYSAELSAVEIMAVEEHLAALYSVPLQRPAMPPVTRGMLAWYTGGSMEPATNKWRDVSGGKYHVAISSAAGTVTQAQPTASTQANYVNGQAYIRGGTSGQVVFPSPILPPTYTVFHITK